MPGMPTSSDQFVTDVVQIERPSASSLKTSLAFLVVLLLLQSMSVRYIPHACVHVRCCGSFSSSYVFIYLSRHCNKNDDSVGI